MDKFFPIHGQDLSHPWTSTLPFMDQYIKIHEHILSNKWPSTFTSTDICFHIYAPLFTHVRTLRCICFFLTFCNAHLASLHACLETITTSAKFVIVPKHVCNKKSDSKMRPIAYNQICRLSNENCQLRKLAGVSCAKLYSYTNCLIGSFFASLLAS